MIKRARDISNLNCFRINLRPLVGGWMKGLQGYTAQTLWSWLFYRMDSESSDSFIWFPQLSKRITGPDPSTFLSSNVLNITKAAEKCMGIRETYLKCISISRARNNVPCGDSKEAPRLLPSIGCFQKVRAEGARPLSLMQDIKHKVSVCGKYGSQIFKPLLLVQ